MPKLRVVRVSEGNAKYVPGIRVAGKWLEECGFKLGDQVFLEASDGKIEITRTSDTEREERGEHGNSNQDRPN